MTLRMELCCCEMVMLSNIPKPEMKQKDVALLYAMSICSSEAKEHINWEKVNAAITARWPKGLTRVKEMAWKIIEQNSKQREATR